MDEFVSIFLVILNAVLAPIIISLTFTLVAKFKKIGKIDIPARSQNDINAIFKKKVIYSVAKRVLSFIFALLAILLFSPFYILSYILSKIYFGNSIIKTFCLGKDLKNISLYKFQTHGNENHKKLSKHSNSYSEFLKITSLNMLPRFVNVLIGDIDLIGVYHYDSKMYIKYPNDIDRILRNGKPGLVSYSYMLYIIGELKNSGDIRNIIEADLDYLSHQNLFLDIRLMCIIVVSVFKRFNEPIFINDEADELKQNDK